MIECPECKTEIKAASACPACGKPLESSDAKKNPFKPQPVKTKTSTAIVALIFLLGCGFLVSTQLTIFVIPPIGAVPEGKTLIISRMDKTEFIDSADAMCERIQGGVSLLCRGTALASISENASIYLRLPYVEFLYLISTGGQVYSN